MMLSMTTFLRRAVLRPVQFLATALLMSCGGSDGVGSGGTGLASSGSQYGAINGFGSVIVESNRYDDSMATVTIEEDPANPRAVTNADLRLGMQVQVVFDSTDRALSIRAIPSVLGRIDVLTASTMQVAGQTIVLTGTPAVPLVLDGAASLSELAVGDRVVVYGRLDHYNRVLATRIERRASSQSAVTRVSGPVSAIAPGGTAFTIGGLAVAMHLNSGALTASLLKLDPEEVISDSTWRSSGAIRDLATAGKTLRLGEVLVDYSSSRFQDGVVSDLANGKIIRVKGVSRQGVLVASEIQFTVVSATVDDDDRTDSSGTVTNYVSAMSFYVRGTAHSLLANAEIRNGSLSKLRDGAKVRVRGRPVGNVVMVERLEFLE
jgi:Domain of unknown function (DUF5666)